MKTTILKELTRKLPVLNNCCRPGMNTFQDGWESFLGWTPWAEFNARDLYAMFSDVLETEWEVPSNLAYALLEHDKTFYNEDMLEHQVISRLIIPVVNAALQHACKIKHVDYTPWLARYGGSSFVSSEHRPDWVLCSTANVNNYNYFVARMAGDTKESHKFHSSNVTMIQGPNENHLFPVRQVVTYATYARSRYAFIITDAELLVLRITSVATGAGIAAQRPRRDTQPITFGHSSRPSADTDISQLSSRLMATSIGGTSSASYQPTPATDVPHVEYRSIPWESHGDGKRHLNVCLALFYTAWLSGVGETDLQFGYPSLDSCWPTDAGDFFRHNSTGLRYKNPVGRLEYPDPSVDRDSQWVSVAGADGAPVDCITLQSALLQDVVRKDGTYHRQYIYRWSEAVEWADDDGQPIGYEERETPVILNADILVYDQESSQVGYFAGLQWVVGFPAPSAKRPRVRSVSTGGSAKHAEPRKHGESSKRSRR